MEFCCNMAKAKIFALVVVIVIIVALVYFYFSGIFNILPETGFSQEYSGLSSVWKSAGLSQDVFHSDFESLVLLQDSQLNSIKQGLSAAGESTDSEAIKSVSSAYVSLVDIALKTKELRALNDSISDTAELCDNVSAYGEMSSGIEELLGLYETYMEKTADFTQKYAAEAEEISFYRIDLDMESQRTELETVLSGIEIIKGECEA